MNLEPQFIFMDFERAIINAMKSQFPNTIIVGCLFHFKQAIRKHLTELKIKPEHISAAMAPTVIDLLTVIPKDEITKKGIPYVKDVILKKHNFDSEDETKWTAFWQYFESFWLSSPSFISCWNIHNEKRGEKTIKQYYDMHNRTNNSMERQVYFINLLSLLTNALRNNRDLNK